MERGFQRGHLRIRNTNTDKVAARRKIDKLRKQLKAKQQQQQRLVANGAVLAKKAEPDALLTSDTKYSIAEADARIERNTEELGIVESERKHMESVSFEQSEALAEAANSCLVASRGGGVLTCTERVRLEGASVHLVALSERRKAVGNALQTLVLGGDDDCSLFSQKRKRRDDDSSGDDDTSTDTDDDTDSDAFAGGAGGGGGGGGGGGEHSLDTLLRRTELLPGQPKVSECMLTTNTVPSMR